jgi:hypothetical protein
VLIGDIQNKTGDPMFDGVVEQALGLGIEGASFISSFARRDALRAAEAIKPGRSSTSRRRGWSHSRRPRPRRRRRHRAKGILATTSRSRVSHRDRTARPSSRSRMTQSSKAEWSADRRRAGRAGAHGAWRHGGADAVGRIHGRESRGRFASTRKGRSSSPPASRPKRFPRFIAATKLDPDFGRGYSSAATAANNLDLRDDAARVLTIWLSPRSIA